MPNKENKKMENELRDLGARKRELEDQLSEFTQKSKDLEINDEENRLLESAKHTEEVEKLKKSNETLKGNLEALLSAPNS